MMKKESRSHHYLLIVIILLVFCLSAKAQSPQLVDSLERRYNEAENPDDRQYWLNRLTWIHIMDNPEAATLYNERAKAIAIAENDRKGLARTHHYDGLIGRVSGDYDKAIYHLNEALTIFDEYDMHKGMSGVLFNLGVVYGLKGDYEKSLEYYYRQIALDESVGDTAIVASTLNSIGSINRKQGNYTEAIRKYKESSRIFTQLKRPGDVAIAINNLGNVYLELNMPDSAYHYAAEAMVINRERNELWGISTSLHTMGVAMARLDQPKRAEKYLSEALLMRRELGHKLEMAETMSTLGLVWFDLGLAQKGVEIMTEGLALAQSISAYETQTTIHRELAEAYKKSRQYQKATFHMMQYANLRDTVLTRERLTITADLEAKYQTAKKDQQLAENELIIAEAEAKAQRQRMFLQIAGTGAVGLLMVVGLLIILSNERRKRNQQQLAALRKERELVALKAMMTGEEKERTRIARDLHDGLSGLLAAVKMQLSAYQNSLKASAPPEKLTKATDLLDNASAEVRRIAHNMMPEILLKYGLMKAISELVDNINAGDKVKVELSAVGTLDERLSQNAELAIYRVIQELLNNIVKHSRANEVFVQLARNGNVLNVTVEDNGVGFDTRKLDKEKGMGLGNLESRVGYLNGEMHISSEPERGTSVDITIYLDKVPRQE